ncbi:MAG: NADH-quinone oxidoreductase subunit J [Anaerolineae bacterium]|nr:MAG: NADH-quinone oxidoreductase subunit J [Anaerolineae bacterium]
MTPLQLVFLLTAALTLVAAFRVVTTRNLVHAALWLVVTLFGVAVLFVLLNAPFLAVVQVVVYIGAIAVLFIFAIMLTRREMRDQGAQLNKGWWAAALVSLLTFGGLFWLTRSWDGFTRTAAPLPTGQDTLSALGKALVSPDAFVLPFEIASVLLLAALVGAVYVAYREK